MPARVVWDGRVSRPEPWPDDPDALIEPLARALDEALRGAVADSGVEQAFVLQVRTPRDGHTFPPPALVAGAEWRDRMRRSSGKDRTAVDRLHDAVEAGAGARLNLVDRLDETALRACRVLTTASRERSPLANPIPVARAVGERLAALLHARPLPGTADPFLALVSFDDGADGADLERARRTAGAAHVERFLASVASTRDQRGKPTPIEQALRDRVALEAHLREGGLGTHAARLAHEVAEVGFLLVAGDARSRLGGPPLLPRGLDWPVSDEGRELTFLAGIDLSELPASRLPASGWLLFFADLGTQVFATDDPVEAAGPGLIASPVVAHAYLMLPYGWGAPAAAGLGVYEGQTYEEVVDVLTGALPHGDGGHWIGGYGTGAQGVVDDTGTLLLFSIEDDDGIGFSFADAGVIQFRIAEGALAARDWSRIVALPDSC